MNSDSGGSFRAATYSRVSTLEQGERGFSLEAQAADCRKLASELGAEVVAEFQDRDSGASWDLPGLIAMLDAGKRREFDLVLCYDPDRLARRMAKQLVIEEDLQRSGVAIRYVTLRNGESAEDQLLKNVRSSIAEYERSKIALRTSRGRRAKAERGMIVGNGWAPYGYRFARDETNRVVGLEPDPPAARIVRRIFVELAHRSVAAICADLNAEGVPTMFGGRWGSSTILGFVDNPAYLGTAAYGRRDTNQKRRDETEWQTIPVPALIDRRTWDLAKEALESRRCRTPARTRDDAFPLRGLLKCGYCGGTLSCLTSGRQRVRYYWCLRALPSTAVAQGRDRCRLPGVLAHALETDVWGRVAATLLDPRHLAIGLATARRENDVAKGRQRARATALDRELERARARLQRITRERLDHDPGSELDRALRALADEVQTTIGRLLAERAELLAEPEPGLTAEDAASLEKFAVDVSEGIDAASTADRRRVFTVLRLRGAVRLGENGIKLGRKHRFEIEWSAVVQLRGGDQEYKKTRLRFYTEAYQEWEAKYMPQSLAVPAS